MPLLLGNTTNHTPLTSAMPDATLLKQTAHITVRFESGQEALLETDSPGAAAYARVIDTLQQSNRLIAVQTDERGVIQELCIPVAVRVADLAEAEDEITITFHPSSAVYHLLPSHPQFQTVLNTLRAALTSKQAVLVTAATPRYEILDVRPLPPKLKADLPEVQEFTQKAEPLVNQDPIPWAFAEKIFSELSQMSCVPCHSANPCIPFRYAGDGCWIRAHLMAYYIVDVKKLTPQKMWSYGNMLTAHSVNDPNCRVSWAFHVAVTLPVVTDKGTETLVFDPSMFDRPVPVSTWANAQKLLKPNVSLQATEWEAWYRGQGTASKEKAETEIVHYRQLLDTMCADHGAPPYSKCAWVPRE